MRVLVVCFFVALLASVVEGGSGSCSEHAFSQARSFVESQPSEGKFHVQGWRWHTLSMVREVERLKNLAEKLRKSGHTQSSFGSLRKAADYVVGFNMKGLHRIERDLFFPWVRTKIGVMEDSEAANALSAVLGSLESDRIQLELMGGRMQALLKLASDSSASQQDRQQAIDDVATLSAQIVDQGRSMIEREDSVLVPAVGQLVEEAEQKSFNNRVIRNLGILDSRLHLVGMHEAVQELGDTTEEELFRHTIPAIPQKLIPRWKKNLYEPATAGLDQS